MHIDLNVSHCQNNNKKKHLHERCVRFIHNEKLSSYEARCINLEQDVSISVHHRNAQSLAIKMFQKNHGHFLQTVANILK